MGINVKVYAVKKDGSSERQAAAFRISQTEESWYYLLSQVGLHTKIYLEGTETVVIQMYEDEIGGQPVLRPIYNIQYGEEDGKIIDEKRARYICGF